jgi:glutathione S-transferase
MLRIWGRTTSGNVQKVMWTIGELGLPHERIDVGREFGGLDTDDYGALNPNRRIPTLEDGDVVVWESNVIVRYLSAKFGSGTLWPLDAATRAIADEWMDWQQTTLLPDIRTVFWGLVRASERKYDRAQIAAAVSNLKTIWSRLDHHLRDRRFVAGDVLTMGDIPVGAACHRYYALGVERAPLEHLHAWYERLQSRDAFRQHVMIPLE